MRRGDLGRGIDVVVVDCGRHWKPMLPFVLLRVGGETEELFYPLVFPFRESVCLGVECRGDVLFDLQLLTKGFGEVGGEAGVLVRDDLGGESEPPVDVF